MPLWLIKQTKNVKRVCYVAATATFGCPGIDGLQPQFSGAEHSYDTRAGKYYTSTISVVSEVVQEDTGEGAITVKTMTYKSGKVSEKSLPVCKCGKTFVKRGYLFSLKDEDHSTKAEIIPGFARDSTKDKLLEKKFFKTRKAANNHRDVLYRRAAGK